MGDVFIMRDLALTSAPISMSRANTSNSSASRILISLTFFMRPPTFEQVIEFDRRNDFQDRNSLPEFQKVRMRERKESVLKLRFISRTEEDSVRQPFVFCRNP